MGQTLTEKIFSHKVGRDVQPGELVIVEPDVVMSHDSLTPSIIDLLRNDLGRENVHNRFQLVIVMDHVAPASTVEGRRRIRIKPVFLHVNRAFACSM